MTIEQEQRLSAAVKNDPIYQQLLSDCEAMEQDFLRIRQILTKPEQEILDRYISLCEELEYRRTSLAMDMACR